MKMNKRKMKCLGDIREMSLHQLGGVGKLMGYEVYEIHKLGADDSEGAWGFMIRSQSVDKEFKSMNIYVERADERHRVCPIADVLVEDLKDGLFSGIELRKSDTQEYENRSMIWVSEDE